MIKHKDTLAIIIFLILVVLVWAGIAALPEARIVALSESESGYDLTEGDLENTIYTGAAHWQSWPEKLYSPADFESGEVTDAPVQLTDADYKQIQYATHRLTLTLPAEQLYALYVRSSDFSMRLFIDGVEIDSVGTPGDSRETTEPRVSEKTYFFTPQNETVDIIVQAANFVHGKSGCQPPELTIGTPENVLTHTGKLTAFRFAVIGCLLTAALYHLGLFVLNHKRKGALYFSICCALFALMTKTAVLTFLTNYNFFFWIRVEYLTHFLVFMMLTLFIHTLFPRTYNKWVLRGYYTLVGVYSLLTLLTDTVFFTGLLVYFEIVSALIIGYTIVKLAIALRGGGMKHLLAFLGTLAVALPGLLDMLYYRGIIQFDYFIGQYFITPIGMMFFVFCYALVLSIEYAETERARLVAEETGATLERVNRLKTDIMRTISHETLTPLAVMMGFAEITAKDARASGMNDEIVANLNTIADEASRLAAMMEEMRQLALSKEYSKDRRAVDVTEVIQKIAGLYGAVLERKGTRLELDIADGLPLVYGNESELVQVIFNLLRNADKATENGTVTISAESEKGRIKVTISDTGTGIAPELLPYVFERGVHGSEEGTGYGLAVCHDIITSYGGEIGVDSGDASGTNVFFTLPPFEDAEGRHVYDDAGGREVNNGAGGRQA